MVSERVPVGEFISWNNLNFYSEGCPNNYIDLMMLNKEQGSLQLRAPTMKSKDVINQSTNSI